MDVDYYARCFAKFGEPKILDTVNVVSRIGAHQISSTQTREDLQEKEFIYILKKYEPSDYTKRLFFYRAQRKLNWLKSETCLPAGRK